LYSCWDDRSRQTTLRSKVENLLIEQMIPAMATDPGRLPFVSVEVAPPDTGRFRWRDYFSRLLAAMNEPLINSKIPDGRCAHATNAARSALSGMELGFAAEQALRYRCPPVVFVDEEQHLARIASGRRLSDQLDVIKSLANRRALCAVGRSMCFPPSLVQATVHDASRGWDACTKLALLTMT
jgi:hypothetical protein